MKWMCVFCGSAPGARPAYTIAARTVGQALAARRVGLVYGGASVGTMGVVAHATLAAGGEVIGVIPEQLRDKELAYEGLTELHVVSSMHERKALMTELCDAFLALPGGFGTLDELFEALTWSQLGIHDEPIGLWNLQSYWTPLVTLLDHMVEEGFVSKHNRERLWVGDLLDPLLDDLLA